MSPHVCGEGRRVCREDSYVAGKQECRSGQSESVHTGRVLCHCARHSRRRRICIQREAGSASAAVVARAVAVCEGLDRPSCTRERTEQGRCGSVGPSVRTPCRTSLVWFKLVDTIADSDAEAKPGRGQEHDQSTPMAQNVRHRSGVKCHHDVASILTVAKIDDAVPRLACPRAIDPRGEREAKPPADDSCARRGRQEGGRIPGKGICAVDKARRSRRRGRRRRAPRAHHRDERRCRARQADAEPHGIQLRRAEGDVPHQQVLHLAREHRVDRPVTLAHVQVGAAHRQREAHRRRRRDAHTVPVDLGGPVGVGEARPRLHDRDVSPHVCGEGRRPCTCTCREKGARAYLFHVK